MSRVLTPEILDELSPTDPAAIRSRTDLRRINAAMGNYRWIARQMRAHADAVSTWIELGAGDGGLARHLPADSAVTGLDFAPRPDSWPEIWDWQSGDLFETFPAVAEKSKTIGVVANLFLHHFTNDQLGKIGQMISDKATVVIASEPARHFLHQAQGALAYPFVNYVTRHDMRVSIEAGFRGDELSEAMGLPGNFESISTSHQFFGAYRLTAARRQHDRT